MTDLSNKNVLIINTGSSSLKAGLYRARQTESPARLLAIDARRIGLRDGRMRIAGPNGAVICEREGHLPDQAAAIEALLAWLKEHNLFRQIYAVGHRLVHGGPSYRDPQLITPELIEALHELEHIDPDHLPQALGGIELVAGLCPGIQQVACFDTAFHRHLPSVARMYALPGHFYDEGLMRYGFHGLSYEYIMEELHILDGPLAEGRVIVAHLGNGASMAAIKQGKSMDTSMGFTPVEGLVMGTRSGDLDPGAVIHLIEQRNMSSRSVEKLIGKQSGLLGVSGISEDMHDLLDRESAAASAGLAIELFCYRAKKYLGAYAAALGGVDIVVFTGGIGENAAPIRERICSGLAFLGISTDAARNLANSALISPDDSPVKVRVIKTDEALMIAKHTIKLLV
jgi:acetate kinase